MVDPAGSAPVPALAHTLAYGEQCLYTEVYGDRGFSIRGLIITGTLEKPKCECFRDRERIVLFFEADLFGQDLRICLGRFAAAERLYSDGNADRGSICRGNADSVFSSLYCDVLYLFSGIIQQKDRFGGICSLLMCCLVPDMDADSIK